MKRKTIFGVALICVLCSTAPLATTDAEQDALEKIVDELDQLNKLIDKAERESDSTERVRFRYDWLRRDLKLVKDGIQDHLDVPSTEPKTFDPLLGDYRQ
ncbi:MAG: RAQPRD family integrative conjugative element protein [Gammaproteobacteria bacterium]|nr:RAQPRD family integrative conjugative element protein [Gammaproteobacteria bacterium]